MWGVAAQPPKLLGCLSLPQARRPQGPHAGLRIHSAAVASLLGQSLEESLHQLERVLQGLSQVGLHELIPVDGRAPAGQRFPERRPGVHCTEQTDGLLPRLLAIFGGSGALLQVRGESELHGGSLLQERGVVGSFPPPFQGNGGRAREVPANQSTANLSPSGRFARTSPASGRPATATTACATVRRASPTFPALLRIPARRMCRFASTRRSPSSSNEVSNSRGTSSALSSSGCRDNAMAARARQSLGKSRGSRVYEADSSRKWSNAWWDALTGFSFEQEAHSSAVFGSTRCGASGAFSPPPEPPLVAGEDPEPEPFRYNRPISRSARRRPGVREACVGEHRSAAPNSARSGRGFSDAVCRLVINSIPGCG